MADYELRCPFCGEATVDGRCPSCSSPGDRPASSGTTNDRTRAHVDVSEGAKFAGSVDRMAIYSPAGGRSSWFARLATFVAASVSVWLFITVTIGLVVGFVAALVGGIRSASPLASAALFLAAFLALVALTVSGTGLYIVWQHRGDYAASRRAAASAPVTQDP